MTDSTDESDSHGSQDRHQEFIRLFARHQRQIYAQITMLLADPVDVDEVLQETSLVLWSKFDRYRRDESFVNWARGVAHLEVLRFYRRNRRRLLPLEERVIEQLAADRESMHDALGDRRAHLAECLKELRAKDRQLVELCYQPDGTFKDAAEQLGRPVNAVYKSLGRIRRALHDCIGRKTAAGSR